MEQVRVVALLRRRHAEMLEAVKFILGWINAGAPAFVAERRIGDNVVKGLERAAVLELGNSQRAALLDERRWIVVQDHVHPREGASSGILFLPIQRDPCAGLIAPF